MGTRRWRKGYPALPSLASAVCRSIVDRSGDIRSSSTCIILGFYRRQYTAVASNPFLLLHKRLLCPAAARLLSAWLFLLHRPIPCDIVQSSERGQRARDGCRGLWLINFCMTHHKITTMPVEAGGSVLARVCCPSCGRFLVGAGVVPFYAEVRCSRCHRDWWAIVRIDSSSVTMVDLTLTREHDKRHA